LVAMPGCHQCHTCGLSSVCCLHFCAARSPVLLSGLGWDAPLTGAVLGSQLAALGTANRHVTDGAHAQKLARVVPGLYAALSGLQQQELAAAAAVLEGQPSVWVGNGFVPAERVAFKVSACTTSYAA